MIALHQASLPSLEFTERWRILHPSKGWDRGITDTAVSGSRILFIEETAREKGAYGCLDAATGKRLWSVPLKLETTQSLSANARYGVLWGEHRILVFDVKDGHKVWSSNRQGFGAGPLLVGDRLCVELKRNVLSAVELPKGRIAWRDAYPARIQIRNPFGHLTAIGNSLWSADSRGYVTKRNLKDGHAAWGVPFSGGEVTGFVPTRHGVAVFGAKSVEMWDPLIALAAWKETFVAGWSPGFYQPATDALWTVSSEGRLHRFDAKTGRRLGEGPARPEGYGPTFDPVSYRGGLLVLSGGPIVQLDPQGRQVAQFDPQEGIYGVTALGSDILLRSENGLVRLSPGAISLPADLAALAARLVARPKSLPGERRTLLRLGRAALPALLAAVPKAAGERANVLTELLARTADRRDTERMLDIADAKGVFTGYGIPVRILTEWLEAKADPDVLAARLLPRLKAARDETTAGNLIALLLRSPAPLVVDELLARLRSPKSSSALKGLIYGGIAASGRQDVLDEILRLRAEGRRLAMPIAALSATKDSDADGLPDNVDANPVVAPGPLDETQAVLLALFDARFRFDERTGKLGVVDYGDGVKPFELLGWKGGLVPQGRGAAMGLTPTATDGGSPYAFLRFDSRSENVPTVRFNASRTEATASVGATYGCLDGTGYEGKLRKMGGQWFVVSLRMVWIS